MGWRPPRASWQWPQGPTQEGAKRSPPPPLTTPIALPRGLGHTCGPSRVQLGPKCPSQGPSRFSVPEVGCPAHCSHGTGSAASRFPPLLPALSWSPEELQTQDQRPTACPRGSLLVPARPVRLLAALLGHDPSCPPSGSRASPLRGRRRRWHPRVPRPLSDLCCQTRLPGGSSSWPPLPP